MSNDNGIEVDNQIDDEDNPFLRDRVYYAAKDGLSIAMYELLKNVKDDDTKNAIINQVRNNNIDTPLTKHVHLRDYSVSIPLFSF